MKMKTEPKNEVMEWSIGHKSRKEMIKTLNEAIDYIKDLEKGTKINQLNIYLHKVKQVPIGNNRLI